ncbi:hypothetical protein MBAV_004769 [Candidatus Magnetobacterium bavaricum]|uniref:Uncharacterized protein n=1 Tax=Candidatus Magnetobacterium bavaricum TaxID=29290 RepID=A0A0F3GM38_9BACT|nr:hypothetical protein MBAV_004769 [Candidatus Magnetobacterium bavaricum]
MSLGEGELLSYCENSRTNLSKRSLWKCSIICSFMSLRASYGDIEGLYERFEVSAS